MFKVLACMGVVGAVILLWSVGPCHSQAKPLKLFEVIELKTLAEKQEDGRYVAKLNYKIRYVGEKSGCIVVTYKCENCPMPCDVCSKGGVWKQVGRDSPCKPVRHGDVVEFNIVYAELKVREKLSGEPKHPSPGFFTRLKEK